MKNITSIYAKDNGIKNLKEILKIKKIIKSYKDNKNGSDVYEGLFDRRSWLDDERVWHVYPIAIEEVNKREANVYIICPICGTVHRHGMYIANPNINIDGVGDFLIRDMNKKHPRYERIGHRVCHCSSYLCNSEKSKINSGYIIENPTCSQLYNFNY